jgi:aryl-alcohol dehydrogenase-like predicted oxidoreductase
MTPTESNPFTHTLLGRTGIPVFRLGLSASYFPGVAAVGRAVERGVNLLFLFGFDVQMVRALRELLPKQREKLVVVSGAYNLVYGHLDIRRSLERRLRQLRTDYIDAFLLLGVMHEKEFTEEVREDLLKLKEEGKVRAMGLSTHDRKFAGTLAREGKVDVLMIRYNAAHRGAEEDIFPFLQPHNPGVIGYTATRWRYLIRRSKKWPAHRPVPSPGQTYRFVLSSPHIHAALTAPRSVKQLDQNLDALAAGPLTDAEMDYICRYGDAVRRTRKWFL